MKKIICSILIFVMLPIMGITLAGCNNKNTNIKNFYSTYKNIASYTTNLKLVDANDVYQIKTTSYKIDVDYGKSLELNSMVNDSSSPYYNLKHFYQQLLDDSLSPLYFYGESISKSKSISKDESKALFNQLYALTEDYKDIDHYVGILIKSINNMEDESIHLSYLKRVFVEYEQAINTANSLSALVCNIYLGKVYSNSNYNYYLKTADQLNEADFTRLSMDVRTRMYYYKSVYANVFYQMYVRGNNLSQTLSSTDSATKPTYTPYNQLSQITSLTNKSNEYWVANRNSIYSNALALYNVQNSFANAYSIFVNATNKVEYSSINESSSTDAINYGKIINEFAKGIAVDSYEILNTLTNLLYS